MQEPIQLIQTIVASPERIWRGCTQPEALANWQADKVEGRAMLGGTLRLHWPALEAHADLKIVEWVPRRSVAYQQGQSLVRLELEGRRLQLTHSGLDATDDRPGLAASWQVSLAQLAHYLERHPGRQRRVRWLLRPVRGSAEMVYLALTQPALARQWFATGAALPQAGESFALQLLSGQQLTGRVLANLPGRDVALTLDQAGEGTLIVRTLPLQEQQRLLALVWSEWGAPTAAAREIFGALEQQLGRLDGLLKRVGSA